ncbi:Heavy-metal-associated domain family protein [Acanthocheilonema viteae]
MSKMSNTYTFELNMTCEGCANAARKVLSKLGDDISDVQIDVGTQRVIVKTTLPADSVLATLEKTGKKCKQIC